MKYRVLTECPAPGLYELTVAHRPLSTARLNSCNRFESIGLFEQLPIIRKTEFYTTNREIRCASLTAQRTANLQQQLTCKRYCQRLILTERCSWFHRSRLVADARSCSLHSELAFERFQPMKVGRR